MHSIVSSCPSSGQLPSVTVTEQRLITSARDLGGLQIIDWDRTSGYWDNNPARAMDLVENWLAHKAAYTVVRMEMKGYPVRTDWPGWEHAGCHAPLGRLFWNAFHATQIGKLEFSDAPDFSGKFLSPDGVVTAFTGDIGKVAVSTFIFTMLQLNTSDLWISVPDAHTQVIIQPVINLREKWDKIRRSCFPKPLPKERHIAPQKRQTVIQGTLW